MYSPYNPCCTGSFYGTGCTPDCADAIAWRAYSKAWPEAMSGPDPGRLVVASREAVGRMREVIAALDRNGWPLFAHSLHLPMTLLERAASEAMSERCIINLGGGGVHTTLAQPVSLEWGDAP